jgi:dienelactone hydrolase
VTRRILFLNGDDVTNKPVQQQQQQNKAVGNRTIILLYETTFTSSVNITPALSCFMLKITQQTKGQSTDTMEIPPSLHHGDVDCSGRENLMSVDTLSRSCTRRHHHYRHHHHRRELSTNRRRYAWFHGPASSLLSSSSSFFCMFVVLSTSIVVTVAWVHSFQIQHHRIPSLPPQPRSLMTTKDRSRRLLHHNHNHPRAQQSANGIISKDRYFWSILSHRNDEDVLSEDDYDDDNLSFQGIMDDVDDGSELDSFTLNEIERLTVPQLKQQLRLRQLKVSGKKHELVDRLLQNVENSQKQQQLEADESKSPSVSINDVPASAGSEDEYRFLTVEEAEEKMMADQAKQEYMKKRRQKADLISQEYGKEFVDVTAYLDEEDKGKDIKSSSDGSGDPNSNDDDDVDDNSPSSDPEVWGRDARIVEDYEGRSPIVDGLSRTVIQFKGSNQTELKAFVVASRDAMKPFLEGGQNRTTSRTSDPEAQLREIQTKREEAEKRPFRPDDFDGADGGDEAGYYKDVLQRDFSDWGKYSVTGAQLSAEEVQGVLILSDVFGPFTEATKTLAEKIAFECQPVVCMVPDLFRCNPWKEDMTTPGFNDDGQDYEEWRAMHSDLRVSVDIRAAAAVLRERYGVTSIVVWGTCFGGGRALEVAAGYLPDDKVLDVDGTLGPPVVDPDVAVVWYPTRYNAKMLFGSERSPTLTSTNDQKERSFAVIGVFAGKDTLPGATPEDAEELKNLLQDDDRIKDCMVKVFSDQDHGFAHNALGRNHDGSELDRFVDNQFGGAGRVSIGDGDAEVACLLSTAFMETYSRKFLPTVGTPIMSDNSANDWNQDTVMKDFSDTNRDVRNELELLTQQLKDVEPEGIVIDPDDPDDDAKLLDALRAMGAQDGEYKIRENDDIKTAFDKLVAGDDSFQLF